MGMKASTSKSETMVFSWKTVDCLLQVGSDLFPQMEKIKYFRILFMSEGRSEHKLYRRIGAATAVMQSS